MALLAQSSEKSFLRTSTVTYVIRENLDRPSAAERRHSSAPTCAVIYVYNISALGIISKMTTCPWKIIWEWHP